MMRNMNDGRRPNGESKDENSTKKRIVPYWIFAALRIILTLMPQTGYIHPDEYFQSIEVIAGDHFDIDVHKPWEFNVTFPLRTALIPQILVGIPYFVVDMLSPHYSQTFGRTLRTPYVLVCLPRLAMCCLSFVSDYCLYKICCIYSQNYRVRIITYASSYVIMTYATRTFSNTVELVLASLMLYYVSSSMAFSEKVVLQSDHFAERYDKARTIGERVKYYKLRSSLRSHSLDNCLIIATITVVGIFNRPTFVAFAFPPIFFWLQRGLGSRSVNLLDFHIRIVCFVFCAIPATIFLIITDSFYFGYLTLGEIINLDISIDNFVVTPLNFLKYNLNEKNLSDHGLHPRFLHFVVNVPLLFNILGIIGLVTFGRMIYSGLRGRWLDLPRIQSIEGLMTASFIVPIAALSLVPHQEPRFIIPALLPLVFLHSQTIANGTKSKTIVYSKNNNNKNSTKFHYTRTTKNDKINKFQCIWLMSNFLMTIFYGFVHQAGVFPLATKLATELRAKPHLTHVHLHTSYTYSMPTALLQLRNTRRTYTTTNKQKYRLNKDFHLHEEGSNNVERVYDDIYKVLHDCERKFLKNRLSYRIYYALPASFMDEFVNYANENTSNCLSYETVENFYPHFVTEKLPNFRHSIDCIFDNDFSSCLKKLFDNTSRDIYEFTKQFRLVLLKIEIVKTNSTVFS